ncbi:MAG: ATP-binding cassette domain-containing protein, partial [Phycicoccus sp.]
NELARAGLARGAAPTRFRQRTASVGLTTDVTDVAGTLELLDRYEAEMVEALRAAQVWGLVESLPSGLDTVVGDRGHRLSGGEKQRLAIARLLLKGPGLIVLDEATAHLDSESEQALQAALDNALRDRTALVIAHRLSTVRHADEILVVDEGRIVERGTHAELVARGGLYAELYRTQFRDDLADLTA